MPDSPAATKGAEDWGAPIPELVQLGERLGSARREQGLSLDELAARLRLGSEQLIALEAGDHTHLPEAVFVVAQAKRVAGALRIDVSQQITLLQSSRLMRLGRNPAASPFPERSAARPAPRGRSRAASAGARGSGWLWLAALLLGGTALALVALLRQPAAAPPRVAAAAPAPRRPPAAAPPITAGQLLLQSREPSWLEVRDGAGVVLFRGTLRGEKRFPLGTGLKVMAGRPDLVTASSGPAAARPLGRIDQVEWRTFSPTPAAP